MNSEMVASAAQPNNKQRTLYSSISLEKREVNSLEEDNDDEELRASRAAGNHSKRRRRRRRRVTGSDSEC